MAFRMKPPKEVLFGKEPKKNIAVEVEFEVIRTELDDGIAGEANNDDTIFIDETIPEGSVKEKEVVAHEGQHMKDMKNGILDYEDDHIVWKGKKYERKDGMIKYNGAWLEEGYKDFPWEIRAYKAGEKAKK